MEIKDGTKTSEYRVAMLSQLISAGLIGLGIFDPAQVDELSQHIMLIIGGVGMIFSGVTYIYSRTKVKTAVKKVTETTVLEVADKSKSVG